VFQVGLHALGVFVSRGDARPELDEKLDGMRTDEACTPGHEHSSIFPKRHLYSFLRSMGRILSD
jgi:hypothetical protein